MLISFKENYNNNKYQSIKLYVLLYLYVNFLFNALHLRRKYFVYKYFEQGLYWQINGFIFTTYF